MIKRCAICGEEFKSSPSSKKITCGKSCSVTRKSQTHKGKHNRWTDSAKEKIKGIMSENLKLGTEAARKSIYSGPFETNYNALLWTLISPDGVIYNLRNLNKFIRDNPGLFDGTPEQARSGIMQIKRYLEGKTKRTVTQWKGWRLLKVEYPSC